MLAPSRRRKRQRRQIEVATGVALVLKAKIATPHCHVGWGPMPDIAASTSNQRSLTSSRIGAQIVSGPDPARAMVPICEFTQLMIAGCLCWAERWI